MVERVWGGVRHGPAPITFDEADFRKFQDECGQRFDAAQRRRIEDAANDYHSMQAYEWASPQPAAVRKKITELREHAAALAETWRTLGDGSDGSVIAAMLANATITNRRSRIAPDEFDSWAADTIVRLEYLVEIATSALARISAKRTGGPRTAKGQFHVLVDGLADVYAEAAGELHVTYDDLASAYRRIGFLALVDAVQGKLPREFRYNGGALGKTVQKLVRRKRGETHAVSRGVEEAKE